MNRLFPSAMAVVAALALLAIPLLHVTGGIQPTSDTRSKGVIHHVPIDALRIRIDDENKPFLLENLDRRFNADDLIAFMNGFLLEQPERSEPPCIMIGSDTKRIVAGEEVVNERLRQLAAKHGVNVIILPAPTGRDPDSKLRKFAEQFKQQKPSKPEAEQQTNR